MKLAHNIKITVFAKEENNKDTIKNSLLKLFPFNLEQERIELKEQNALGFNERKIKIYELFLKKEKHVNKFLKDLNSKLSKEQKELLLKQVKSRLDKELNFFLRLDKDKLINENKYWITDSGDCFHIKISIAAFPAKKDTALAVVKEIFKP